MSKNKKAAECLFCKIINKQEESAVIWQNDFCTAILDLFPNTHGSTVLLTNKHYDSDIFDSMNGDELQQFFSAVSEVIKLLKKKLNVKRVAVVVEGMGINHAHIKLYPMHGLTKNFQEMRGSEKIFFQSYEGYLSTQIGPRADRAMLRELAKKISKKHK